ncbi:MULTISPECIES: phasin family protein [Tropicimonas]|nr:phasin family protein [Tropicimonas sediminicola]
MAELLSDWQRAGMGALAWMNPVWVRSMTEMGNEMMQFSSDRIREGIRFQGEILQCCDPVAFREIQGRYLKTAFEQYSAETGKLVRMNRAALDEVTGRSSGS